jgi:flagellar M-ring protein FliF
MHLPQGTVKRQSVSVLIDQEVKWEKQGNQMQATLVAPSAEKMKMIRDLVAGVIGLNETRGDQLTLETLPFETTRNAEPPMANPAAPGAPAGGATQSPFEKFGLPKNVVMGVGGGVLLLLVGGVIFVMTRKKSSVAPAQAALQGATGDSVNLLVGGSQPISDSGQRQLPGAKIEMNSLVSQVRDAARKDADTYAEVLQDWLVEEKAK